MRAIQPLLPKVLLLCLFLSTLLQLVRVTSVQSSRTSHLRAGTPSHLHPPLYSESARPKLPNYQKVPKDRREKKQALYLSIQGFSSLPPNPPCSSSFYRSFQRPLGTFAYLSLPLA